MVSAWLLCDRKLVGKSTHETHLKNHDEYKNILLLYWNIMIYHFSFSLKIKKKLFWNTISCVLYVWKISIFCAIPCEQCGVKRMVSKIWLIYGKSNKIECEPGFHLISSRQYAITIDTKMQQVEIVRGTIDKLKK